jgi:3-methyl-2-oxobutanoate hydroxymethyltransferase
MLGLTPDLKPKFVKHYDSMFARGVAAARAFCDDVRQRAFPGPEHTFDTRRAPKLASIG